MINSSVKAGIRLRHRAEELQKSNNGMTYEFAMGAALIEELERINDILRKHNFQ